MSKRGFIIKIPHYSVVFGYTVVVQPIIVPSTSYKKVVATALVDPEHGLCGSDLVSNRR